MRMLTQIPALERLCLGLMISGSFGSANGRILGRGRGKARNSLPPIVVRFRFRCLEMLSQAAQNTNMGGRGWVRCPSIGWRLGVLTRGHPTLHDAHVVVTVGSARRTVSEASTEK
ncbi:hypothetical protein B0I37DRAFT_379680 [Chaetomium sp. MPI-CAGE-AT-0009]|nr:hypothetical protein B0I37DRAFT_379680 [Chaetomium sp. MPI-CAGE-AT-0009]